MHLLIVIDLFTMPWKLEWTVDSAQLTISSMMQLTQRLVNPWQLMICCLLSVYVGNCNWKELLAFYQKPNVGLNSWLMSISKHKVWLPQRMLSILIGKIFVKNEFLLINVMTIISSLFLISYVLTWNVQPPWFLIWFLYWNQ